MNRSWIRRAVLSAVAALACTVANAGGTVGTTLPAGFPAIEDASLGKPLIGFGAAGAVHRTPVIFIHGNNDTPFPTACNPFFGWMQSFAQFFADSGYGPSELWGLGYEGDQCDLAVQADPTPPSGPTRRSSIAHTNAANVPDLRRFVAAVLESTGARQVDIVAHSLGVTITREWLRQDDAYRTVRRFVAIDGPNHGIINCSPNPANFYQAPAQGGFTPSSEVCVELGSPDTPFLRRLNKGDDTPQPTRYLVIRNADTSFVYFSRQDGPFLPPVPAEDSFGQPTDFSRSATLRGARQLDLVGQGAFDPILGTAHLGILNSPQTRQAALEFLTSRHPH
jgi:pimeloyl-ACP methyl ester carboxylesterase